MVLTKDITLPIPEELNFPEVKVSTATLMAAAPYIGKMCEVINNEFILCRQELNDPRCCIVTGKQTTGCAMEALRRIKRECLDEFKQYANCIAKSSGDFSFRHCRRTQAVFDDCMKNKLCVERPDFGYFCRGRIHTSTRDPPEPPPCPCHPKVKDATPSLPKDKPRPPARFTSRLYFVTE